MDTPPDAIVLDEIDADDGEMMLTLATSGLACDDLDGARGRFFKVASGFGETLGFAGIEICGEGVGLLRSIVVVPGHRRQGLGRGLVEAMAEIAAGNGVGDLYLLTTDAATFFAGSGFAAVGRDQAPAALRTSRQMAAGGCASATLMHRRLGG